MSLFSVALLVVIGLSVETFVSLKVNGYVPEIIGFFGLRNTLRNSIAVIMLMSFTIWSVSGAIALGFDRLVLN